MATLTELRDRVIDACSVSHNYDAQVETAVLGAVKRLLQDYNFPKSIMLEIFDDVDDTTTEFEMPAGFKKPLGVRLHKTQDGQDYWSDPLRRSSGFTLPDYGACRPTAYWLIQDTLTVNAKFTEAGHDLYLWYQSQDVDANMDWLMDDHEDAVFYFAVCRACPILKKPDVLELFSPLWADERTSLAIYTNELEFQDLVMEMREPGQRRSERYPSTSCIPAVG